MLTREEFTSTPRRGEPEAPKHTKLQGAPQMLTRTEFTSMRNVLAEEPKKKQTHTKLQGAPSMLSRDRYSSFKAKTSQSFYTTSCT